MAIEEHVALLTKGVAAWNKWRDEYPNVAPQIRGADLREANLSGLSHGDQGMHNIAVRFGVGTGTVQRIRGEMAAQQTTRAARAAGVQWGPLPTA
jgi:hypothetical protein